MQTRNRNTFTTIHTEGALLPVDLLQRISENDSSLEGLDPQSYHLAPGEKINEAVNRSWNRMNGLWGAFKTARGRLGPDDAGTTLTRERWLLPLFQELGFGRLSAAKAVEIEGKSYPISHHWQNIPLHLVGCGLDLDRRTPGAAGAARISPHSLLQEYLNRNDNAQWGLLSNGLSLRILRDNATLTRQAYVDFDLESMFEGEVYSDFVLLWLLAHQSRFETIEKQSECLLERWSKSAQERGTRALDDLRRGVEEAIVSLGQGFLQHPLNAELRDRLKKGDLPAQDYYRQLLRLVYRLIFLFAAEDRGLLLLPDAPSEAKERYLQHYSTTRLRGLAECQRGSRHHDRYEALRLVMTLLGSDKGCPELAIPALGGFLFDPRSTADLNEARLDNQSLLSAVRSLAFIREKNTRRAVDYRNLGPEELGSVYESLLELHPMLNIEAGTFQLTSAAGNERKTTGSYYTPTSLIRVLLDSALDPVIEDRLKGKETPVQQEQALLDLKVCDPTCGSGHFLIAAAHRIAGRLAQARAGGDEPPPNETRRALRDVIRHCVYGVDINPMAVELCKVNLWMESLDPGKPLSFLDHHIQCGNSLLWATPALILKGIPDDAFTPLDGDNKEVCNEFKKRNKREREGQLSLFSFDNKPWESYISLSSNIELLESYTEDTIKDVQRKQYHYEQLIASNTFENYLLAADAWCSAFVWKKTNQFPYPITEEIFRQFQNNPSSIPLWMREEVKRLKEQYKFLHWHLTFPEVYKLDLKQLYSSEELLGFESGFDCIIGNPPWDRPKPEPSKFFASIRPDISDALTSAIRAKILESLEKEDPNLYSLWKEHERSVLGSVAFLTLSGLFGLTAQGKFNLGNVFIELGRNLIGPRGRLGMLNVSGLATDESGKDFIADVMRSHSLVSFYDFENREGIFANVHRSYKFSAITIAGSEQPVKASDFVFYAQNISDLTDKDRHIQFTESDIRLLNPISNNCPVFRSKPQAELVKKIYHRANLLLPPNEVLFQWKAEPTFLFVMSDHSYLFRTKNEINGKRLEESAIIESGSEKFLPLYESKMFHQFEHRWASISIEDGQIDITNKDRENPLFVAEPRYWMREADADIKLKKFAHRWLIAIRGITNPTNERTAISSILPKYPVGHSAQVFRFNESASQACCFISCINSFVFDFAARTKIGGSNLSSFILRQLPILPSKVFTEQAEWDTSKKLSEWIELRVLELIFTSWDMKPFAEASGYYGEPYKWNLERRFQIRCELDAAYCILYGLSLEEIDFILESFPIVKRNDEIQYGNYRTKSTIIEIYKDMLAAVDTHTPYQTRLNSFPANEISNNRKLIEEKMIDSNTDDASKEVKFPIEPINIKVPQNTHYTNLANTEPEKPLEYTKGASPEEKQIYSQKQKTEEANQSQPALTDFGLYKCAACGKMIMGYEKEGHEREKHGGKKVDWKKMR